MFYKIKHRTNHYVYPVFYRVVIFIVIYGLFPFSGLFGQKTITRFQHYTTTEGLSQNMVDCMLKDHKGFLWIGTWNGLCRFDGYSFVTYKKEGYNQNSLQSNFIHSLCQDSFKNIWIGTRQGLHIYLYSLDKIVPATIISNAPYSINSEITSLLIDKNEKLWIGTASNGLYCCNIVNKDGLIEPVKKYSAFQISSNSIISMYLDSRKNIWVGTRNGVNVLSSDGKVIKTYNYSSTQINTITNDVIQAFFEDNKGNMWIGSDFGLSKINLKTGAISRYYYNPDMPSSIAHNTVRAITTDIIGDIVFGTLGGISIYKPETNDFKSHKFHLYDPFGLNNDFVNCLLSDNQGILWIGTETGGLNKLNVLQHKFEVYENDISSKNSLNYNTINSVFEDDTYLWIGTAGGGLNIFNKKNRQFSAFKNDVHNAGSISSNFITTIFRDRDKNTWLGTWGEGLDMLPDGRLPQNSFVHYTNSNISNALINPFVSSIVEDQDGYLWIGTFGGLSMYDKKTKKFATFKGKDNVSIMRIGCLQFDIQGNLWVGTELGLFQILPTREGYIDVNRSRVNAFYHNPNDANSISSDYVISICSDSKGRLWFGTYGSGLNLLVPNENASELKFINFTEKDGLPSNVIYSILNDNNDNIWLSTDNGLAKYNFDKKQIRCYYEWDGLQSNQYYWSAAYKNNKGKLYFGGLNGLNAFYPDSILDDKYIPQPIVTNFKIYNQSVIPGLSYYGRVVTQNTIATTKKIYLSYKVNEFSFDFAAMHFNQPEKSLYKYKLEGFDKDWTYVDAKRRFANYTNIGGGNYRFLVNATNNDGVWNPEPTSIEIIIIPPFWERWWFRILLFIAILGAIISYNRIKVYSLKKQNLKLEKQVKKRTEQIEIQKEELAEKAELLSEKNEQLVVRQKFIEGQKQELETKNTEIVQQRDKLVDLNKKVQLANKQQLRLFTYISHEFKSPLTLIIAPAEQMLQKNLNTTDGENLKFIVKNAKRLLHLVDQLMELRKIETGKTELTLIQANLAAFVGEIANSFASIAKDKNIDYLFTANPQFINTSFDKDKIENIVYNLLSNAFKYTPSGKSIAASINYCSSSEPLRGETLIIGKVENQKTATTYVEICVSDSGIGISETQMKEIFKRFFRVYNESTINTKGTGIGLYLTREMIKEHYGLLYLSSAEGVGTTFRFLLPDEPFFKNLDIPVQVVNNPLALKEQGTALSYMPDKVYLDLLNKKEKDNLGTTKPLLLLVDDDVDLLKYTSNLLSEAFHVHCCHKPKDAIDFAKNEFPDIIISDVMMPEIDGFELCNILKNDIATSHIPIILLSARAETENFIEGLGIGADDYIPKPFNPSILEAKSRSLIDNRKRLRKVFSENIAPTAKQFTASKTDEQFVDKALRIVNENIASADFSVEDFAQALYISRSLLHKKLTALTGLSANDFVVSIRMKKAALLLTQRDKSISEIAYQIGFSDPKYFSKCFKKHFGKNPSEYIATEQQ